VDYTFLLSLRSQHFRRCAPNRLSATIVVTSACSCCSGPDARGRRGPLGCEYFCRFAPNRWSGLTAA